jgi:rifampicin phosphotransferase
MLNPSTLRQELSGTAFIRRFDRFLEQYGHRGLFETDWSLPRYREDPTPLLHAIRAHLEAPPRVVSSDAAAQQAREADAVWRAFEQKLTWLQRGTILPQAHARIRRIKQYYVWREKCRSEMVRVIAAVRRLHLVLANRFVTNGWLDEPNQYFLATLDEIGDVIRDPQTGPRLRSIAMERSAEMERNRQIPMPLLMRESELPRLIRAASAGVVSDTDDDLHGQTVSGGSVEAEVVVIDSPADFGRMKRGAILVTRATDPSWTSLFTLASGVIVEVGGVLSHASTIAREFGLPALANVRNATKRLRTGERIRLDATGGTIRRISNP